MQKLLLSIFISFGFCNFVANAQDVSSRVAVTSPTNFGEVLVGEAKVRMQKAQKLIVDGYAEDMSAIENLLVDTIRLAPKSPEPYVEMVRFVLWQVETGIADVNTLYRVTELAHIANDLSTSRPIGQYIVCEILDATGQSEAAERLFQTIRKQYPEHIDTYTFEAKYFAETQPQRAIASAQKAIALGQSMDVLSSAITKAITNMSRAGEEAKNLEKFAKIYPDRWIWHRAAASYVDEKNYGAAANAYQHAIQLGNAFESRLQLGVLEYTHLRNAKLAVQYLSDLRDLTLKKDKVNNESLGLILAHLALAYTDAGHEDDAVATIERSLVLGAENPKVANALFNELEARSKENLLLSPLKKFIQSFPMAEYAHIMLGNMSASDKDYKTALKHFSNALLLSPERGDLYSARGHAWYFSANYNEALKDFEQAIRYQPEQASYYYNRACMLVLLGRHSDAIKDLKSALNMNKDLREIAKTDTDLKALRRDEALKSELASLGL